MTGYARTVLTVAAAAALAVALLAQPPQGPPGGAKGGQKGGGIKGKGAPGGGNARAQAPIDLTGNWVSLVTEDWVYRMAVPPKNAKGQADVASIPLSQAARTAANAWDPAKDEASGDVCKPYGAAGLMRMPTHLQIDWADDDTLRIQTTAGTQTRLMRFTGDPTGAPSLQGFSKASWEGIGGGGRGRGAPGGAPGAAAIRPGSMKVVTTNMSGGYLRRNGVPYSANAVLTEYYDVLHEPDGQLYLVILTIVDDPANLSQTFRTSSHFKKEADASKFKPTPCTVR
jgi:hypothetical protein